MISYFISRFFVREDFYNESDSVTETVEKQGTTQKNCGENCGENSATANKIIAAIKENPSVTQKRLVEITGLTRRGIEWQIKQLKEKGIIRRVGADRGGYWEVL